MTASPLARPFLSHRFAPLLALALTLGCSKPKPPTITPKSAQILAVTPVGVQLEVAFDVTNPNGYPLVIHAVDGRFSLGGTGGAELGTAHAEPSSSIPADATSTVTSTLAVGWTNLAALAPFTLSPAAVPYTFAGNATLGGEHLNVTVPFTLTGELTRAQLITAGLKGLSLPGLR